MTAVFACVPNSVVFVFGMDKIVEATRALLCLSLEFGIRSRNHNSVVLNYPACLTF